MDRTNALFYGLIDVNFRNKRQYKADFLMGYLPFKQTKRSVNDIFYRLKEQNWVVHRGFLFQNG